jgi:hypothetical protein
MNLHIKGSGSIHFYNYSYISLVPLFFHPIPTFSAPFSLSLLPTIFAPPPPAPIAILRCLCTAATAYGPDAASATAAAAATPASHSYCALLRCRTTVSERRCVGLVTGLYRCRVPPPLPSCLSFHSLSSLNKHPV